MSLILPEHFKKYEDAISFKNKGHRKIFTTIMRCYDFCTDFALSSEDKLKIKKFIDKNNSWSADDKNVYKDKQIATEKDIIELMSDVPIEYLEKYLFKDLPTGKLLNKKKEIKITINKYRQLNIKIK